MDIYAMTLNFLFFCAGFILAVYVSAHEVRGTFDKRKKLVVNRHVSKDRLISEEKYVEYIKEKEKYFSLVKEKDAIKALPVQEYLDGHYKNSVDGDYVTSIEVLTGLLYPQRHAYALFKTADGEIVYVDYCERPECK